MAAAVGLVVLVIAGVAVITDSHPRLAATNSQVMVSGSVLAVAPGARHCQLGMFIPDEAVRLRVFVGTVEQSPGEPLLVSVADSTGAVVSQARVDDGYPDGALEVPIRPPDHDLANGEVCIQNLGDRPVAFAGHVTPANADALQQQGEDGPLENVKEEIRMDFFRPQQESLWALGPEVARRFSLFKPSFAGSWIMWAIVGLAAAVGLSAVVLTLRQPIPAQDRRCLENGG